MQNLKMLAMGAVISSLFAPEPGAQGGVRQRMAEMVEDAEQLEENKKEAAEDALKWVSRMVEAVGAEAKTAAELFVHVAEFETEDEARAFSAAFKTNAEAREKSGTAEMRACAKTVASHASRINRVIRAVWGTNKRVDGETKRIPSIGRSATLKILKGAGGWAEKIGKLPSSGEGRQSKGETPIQRRLSASNAEVIVPAMDTFAKVLALPTTGKHKVEGAKLEKLGVQTIVSAIKSAPDSVLGDIVEATIARCRISSNPFWQEFGENVRSHWIAQAATADGVKINKGKAKAKTEAKTEAKQ